MRSQVEYEQHSLNSEINSYNLAQQLDILATNFPADKILEDRARHGGLLHTFTRGRKGSIGGISPFDPGRHDPSMIYPQSLGENSELMARDRFIKGRPDTTHVILDTPERWSYFTGDIQARRLSAFLVAHCGHITDVSGGDMIVWMNDGKDAGKVFEEDPANLYMLTDLIEGYEPVNNLAFSEAPVKLSGLLDEASKEVYPNSDMAVVISDFQDEYDDKNGNFTWEEPLLAMADELGTRQAVIQVVSPSHLYLPEGVVDGLSRTTVDAINRSYVQEAERRQIRIAEILEKLPNLLTVHTVSSDNSMPPAHLVEDYFLGK